MLLASPSGNVANNYAGLEEEMRKRMKDTVLHERFESSSLEPYEPIGRVKRGTDTVMPRRASHFEYSGNEPASHSDMSEAEIRIHRPVGASQVSIPENGELPATAPRPMFGGRNTGQMSGFNAAQDPERSALCGRATSCT